MTTPESAGAAGATPPPAEGSTSGADRKHSAGWIVATVLLALSVVGLGIWAVTLNSSNEDLKAERAELQQEVTELKGTVGAQQEAGEAAAEVGSQQIKALKNQVAELQAALVTLEEGASSALEAASAEYEALQQQLQDSEQALAELSAENVATQQAYDDVVEKVTKAQTALAELNAKIAESLDREAGNAGP